MDYHGIQRRTVDDKGRLVLPADMRDQLGASCMISKGYDGALYIWPPAAYEAESERLKTKQISNRKVRLQWRYHFGAVSVHFDGQGRITVPKQLRAYAGITAGGTTHVQGFGDRIELWDAARYDSASAADDSEYAGMDEGSFEAGE